MVMRSSGSHDIASPRDPPPGSGGDELGPYALQLSRVRWEALAEPPSSWEGLLAAGAAPELLCPRSRTLLQTSAPDCLTLFLWCSPPEATPSTIPSGCSSPSMTDFVVWSTPPAQ